MTSAYQIYLTLCHFDTTTSIIKILERWLFCSLQFLYFLSILTSTSAGKNKWNCKVHFDTTFADKYSMCFFWGGTESQVSERIVYNLGRILPNCLLFVPTKKNTYCISLYELLSNLRDVGWKEEKAASWVARRGLRSVRIGSLNPHLLDSSKGHKGI